MITFARSNIPILPACSGFPIIIRIASSDVARNTAINVPNIKDAIKLLDDTLVGTGWRVIQFWRHENYAADCIISNDDEFLQVDFCTHPTTAPTTGPALSTFIISFFVKSLE